METVILICVVVAAAVVVASGLWVAVALIRATLQFKSPRSSEEVSDRDRVQPPL